MDEVKGIVQAKEETKSIQNLKDEQILQEVERRGLTMTSSSK
jgi:hypothetical protein